MKHTVVHERDIPMRTSNNFSSSIFGGGGESRPAPPSAKQLSRIESNKTFQSAVFSGGSRQQLGGQRVTNSIQSHDIFGAGQDSKVTRNNQQDKAVKTRYNQNHEGKTIFQDESKPAPPKQREVKTLQDSNIFGLHRQEGTVQKMAPQRQAGVRVNDNHVNQVIPTQEYQDHCQGKRHAEKKVHQPDFAPINARDMKAQEFFGQESAPAQPAKKVNKAPESTQDARMRKIADSQCSDILNQDKSYLLKQRERREKKKENYEESAFSRNQKEKHSSTIFDQTARETNTSQKVRLEQLDKQDEAKRKTNHHYSNLFGNEHSSAPVQKKPTTEDHNADWKYQNQEIFLTQEEKNKVQKEFENMDCKQKKFRELTSHLENNGKVQDTVQVDRQEKFQEKFDRLEETDFKAEKGGKGETKDLKQKMQTHHQIHGDYTHSAKEKQAGPAQIYEFKVQHIPDGYDQKGFKKLCSSQGIQCVKFDLDFNYLNSQSSGDGHLQLRCKDEGQSKAVVEQLRKEGFSVETFQKKSQKVKQACKDSAKQQSIHRTPVTKAAKTKK